MSGGRPAGEPSGDSLSARPDASAAPVRFTDDDVRLGYVNGLHGVHGEVKVYLYNPGSFLLEGAQVVTLVDPRGVRSARRVEARPGHGKRILARIEGIDSPEAAVAHQGFELVVPRAQLPKTSRGTWYVRDIIGLPVVTDTGQALGALVDVHDTTGLDVWVVRQGATERWVLALKDNIVSVELGDRIVVRATAVQEL